MKDVRRYHFGIFVRFSGPSGFLYVLCPLTLFVCLFVFPHFIIHIVLINDILYFKKKYIKSAKARSSVGRFPAKFQLLIFEKRDFVFGEGLYHITISYESIPIVKKACYF